MELEVEASKRQTFVQNIHEAVFDYLNRWASNSVN